MIIADDSTNEGTGLEPVSLTEIHYIEKLIHNSTLDERMKSDMERRLNNVEFKEEVYEMIQILKENQKNDLNQEFDQALRRAI